MNIIGYFLKKNFNLILLNTRRIHVDTYAKTPSIHLTNSNRNSVVRESFEYCLQSAKSWAGHTVLPVRTSSVMLDVSGRRCTADLNS